MKKKLILMLLAGCIVLSGCEAKENSESHQDNSVEEKEEFQIDIAFSVGEFDFFGGND